ncbi:MAG: hypothetical protein ABIO60_10195 [Aquaticitalea sp.]
MKLKFTIVCLLFMVFHLNAQVDNSNKSVPIPAVETKEEKKEPSPSPILISPENKPSLTKNTENISGIPIKNQVTLKPSEKEFSMMEKSILIDPGKIFEDKWDNEKRKQQLELYENIPPELLGDQFLGDFKTKSEFANVICRDFGEEDGDEIKVLLNDVVVIVRMQLTNGFKTFKIPLTQGINKIDFLALNQGSVGFNTAEFQLFDDKETAISKNNWYLATGKKATLIMVKE